MVVVLTVWQVKWESSHGFCVWLFMIRDALYYPCIKRKYMEFVVFFIERLIIFLEWNFNRRNLRLSLSFFYRLNHRVFLQTHFFCIFPFSVTVLVGECDLLFYYFPFLSGQLKRGNPDLYVLISLRISQVWLSVRNWIEKNYISLINDIVRLLFFMDSYFIWFFFVLKVFIEAVSSITGFYCTG